MTFGSDNRSMYIGVNQVGGLVGHYGANTTHALIGIWNGSVGRLYDNGTLLGTSGATTLNQPSATTRLQKSGAGNIEFGEFMIFAGALTTDQRQALESYLAFKWGLQSLLPAIHPYKSIPAIAKPFVPTSIPGCALWLDALDPSSLSVTGSSVTAWRDKSGNTYDATITGTLTLSNNGVSTASNLTSYSTVPWNIRRDTTPNITLFFVYKWLGHGTASNSTLWGNDVPNSGNRVQFLTFPVFSANTYGYFLNNGYLTNSNEMNTSNRTLYELFSQTGVTNGTSVWFNGTIGSAGSGTEVQNTSYTGTERVYFGGGETSSVYPSYVEFNEIIGYSNVVTADQRRLIEMYLATKWGLVSSLPTTHTLKSYLALAPHHLPTSFSNIAIWIDASTSNAMTLAAGAATSLNEKSTNALFETRNGAAGPTYDASIRGLTFTGTNQVYYYPDTINNSTSSYGFSFVARFGTITPQQLLGKQFDYIGGWSFLGFGNDSLGGGPKVNGTFYWHPNYAPTNASSGIVVTQSNVPYLITGYTSNGSNFIFRINGTVRTTTSGDFALQNSDGSSDNCFGNHISAAFRDQVPGTNNNWTLHEFLFYKNAVTLPQVLLHEGYLAEKWGLTSSLPSTHPFKITPP